jgi:hypothetical protein
MSHPATDVVLDVVETVGDRSGRTQGKEFANAANADGAPLFRIDKPGVCYGLTNQRTTL